MLLYVDKAEVEKTRSLESALQRIEVSIDHVAKDLSTAAQLGRSEKVSELLRALYTCPYSERKDRNPEHVQGTCEWFKRHPIYTKWRDDEGSSLLWVSADPGCGKSVLLKRLIDEALKDSNKIVCYFFFKDDFVDQKTSANAACALLRQLLLGMGRNVPDRVLGRYSQDGSKYTESFSTLWEDFVTTSMQIKDKQIVCFFDALDECRESDRRQLIATICQTFSRSSKGIRIKILATSRPYHNITNEFSSWEAGNPIIHLDGDDDEEKQSISEEIDIVVKHRLESFCVRRRLTSEKQEYLASRFASIPQRTYLWAHLPLKMLEEMPGFTQDRASRIVEEIPSTVDEAYDKILERSIDKASTKLILSLVVAAYEPFTLKMMSLALAVQGSQGKVDRIERHLEPEDRFRNTVRQLCGLFVIIVDSKIYLLHQTARAFLVRHLSGELSGSSKAIRKRKAHEMDPNILKWKHSLPVQMAHRKLAEICLWVLNEFAEQYSEEEFFKYCARFWIRHLDQCDIKPEEDLTALVFKVITVMMTRQDPWWSTSYKTI